MVSKFHPSLLFLLCAYFLGIGFSSGGGNFPGQESNHYIILKAILLLMPVISFAYFILIKPASTMAVFVSVIKTNKYLIGYFSVALLTLLFAVNWQYSLTRLCYAFFSLISLFFVIAHYFIRVPKEQLVSLITKHLNYFSCLALLLPTFVLITRNFPITNFRFELQSLGLVHPNILASFYAQLLLWHVLNYFYKGWEKHHLVFAALFVIMEYLLFSRTAIMALLMITSLMPFISVIYQKTQRALLACITVISSYSLMILLLLTRIIMIDDIAGLLMRRDDMASMMTLTNRTVLWQELSDKLEIKTFIFGYGYSVIDRDFGIDLGTGILYGAHNAYLSVLLGSGVIALVFVLIYLFKNVGYFLKNARILERHILYVSIASYLLFFISCFFSEEIGVNLSITFSYLIFMTNIFLCAHKRVLQ